MSNKKKKWAVSVVLIQHGHGTINISNNLMRVDAFNKDEAIGKGVADSMAEFPEHSIHCFTAFDYAFAEEDKADEQGA